MQVNSLCSTTYDTLTLTRCAQSLCFWVWSYYYHDDRCQLHHQRSWSLFTASSTQWESVKWCKFIDLWPSCILHSLTSHFGSSLGTYIVWQCVRLPGASLKHGSEELHLDTLTLHLATFITSLAWRLHRTCTLLRTQHMPSQVRERQTSSEKEQSPQQSRTWDEIKQGNSVVI